MSTVIGLLEPLGSVSSLMALHTTNSKLMNFPKFQTFQVLQEINDGSAKTVSACHRNTR